MNAFFTIAERSLKKSSYEFFRLLSAIVKIAFITAKIIAHSSRILVVWQFTFTFTGILYSPLQRCTKFGNVTVKNYLNESCCLFCASLFTDKVPSRKGFDVNCQKFI